MPICLPKIDKEQGFTLIEMLVVLTVIGIAATILAVRLPREPGGFQRDRAALELENAIAAARSQARSTGAAVKIIPAQIVPGTEVVAAVIPGPAGELTLYPDGSTTGVRIMMAGAPLLEIDWLTGLVSRND